jgi:hypothetical protein
MIKHQKHKWKKIIALKNSKERVKVYLNIYFEWIIRKCYQVFQFIEPCGRERGGIISKIEIR